jgi:hypothetical protein
VPETNPLLLNKKLQIKMDNIEMESQYLQCKLFITVVPVENQIFKNRHVGVQKPLKRVPNRDVKRKINNGMDNNKRAECIL